MLRAVLLLLLLLPPASLAAAPAAPAVHPEVQELIRLVNRHRERVGCSPLRWDSALARVARRHSADMSRRGFFSHVGPDGDDPFDRMREAGIDFNAAAENLAVGQESAREVFQDWLKSRRHRANLENCRYTHHGIGLDRGHWTHDFARPWDRSR